MDEAGKEDATVITRLTTYSLALYADTPVDVRPTPGQQIGLVPDFSDTRLMSHDLTPTVEELEDFVGGADRVHVVHANIGTRAYAKYFFGLALRLKALGLVLGATRSIVTEVVKWER